METITETDLARLVFGADEMKCESPEHGGMVQCSGDVISICSSCGPDLKYCTAMTNLTKACMLSGKWTCPDCGDWLDSCWTIRPI